MTPAYLWAKIAKKLRLSAISNSQIHRTSKVESGSHVVDSTFGRHSFCGYDCELICVDVGAFSSIANNVKIGGGEHPMAWVGMSPVFYEGRDSVKAKFSTHERPPIERTQVGHDVWIGEGVIIRQGVTIGNGAVVGMGSVVTRDVADYAVVAGSPARILRKRFDEDVIAELLEIQWWNLDDRILAKHAEHITDPRRFIEAVKKG